MTKKPTCFFITAIGDIDTEIRNNADEVLRALKLALDPLGIEVMRGDHHYEPGKIDNDVIKFIQESELCIADVSDHRANVFYEVGRRDETGKPMILLKRGGSPDLPVDISTHYFIPYDLTSVKGLYGFVADLRNHVTPIVNKGYISKGSGISLGGIAEILQRMERKIDRIDRLGSGGGELSSSVIAEDGTDPVDLLRVALHTSNIPMAERAMNALGVRMDRYRWLDQVVEQVAAIGSIAAGDLLMKDATDFFDNTQSFKDKLDYLGCLVSNLNRTDRELENIDLVENLCDSLKILSEGEKEEYRVQIYNQLNRLYHGIFATLDDDDESKGQWIEKAINALNEALSISEKQGFLHYNLAVCLKGRKQPGDLERALQHALRCIELDGEERDEDHLNLACELLLFFDDERFSDYLSLLEQTSPIKARLLRSQWRKQR